MGHESGLEPVSAGCKCNMRTETDDEIVFIRQCVGVPLTLVHLRMSQSIR